MSALEKFGQLGIMEQAGVLAKSNLVPRSFRGKPQDVVIALLWGEEVGLGPYASLQYIDVIEGNATINAEGSNALIRRAGHSLLLDVNDQRCIAKGKRGDTGDEMTVTWTMDMALRAGLAGKDVWKKYTEAMLTSRAVTQISRSLFPDVFMGMSYGPEEVASFAAPKLMDGEAADELAARTAGQPVELEATTEPVEVVSAPAPAKAKAATKKAAAKEEPTTVAEAAKAQAEVNRQDEQRRSFPAPSAAATDEAEAAGDAENNDPVAMANETQMTALRDEIKQAKNGDVHNGLVDAWTKASLPSIRDHAVVLTADQFEVAMRLALDATEKQAELQAPPTDEPLFGD